VRRLVDDDELLEDLDAPVDINESEDEYFESSSNDESSLSDDRKGDLLSNSLDKNQQTS
jgi:hypothetical protein